MTIAIQTVVISWCTDMNDLKVTQMNVQRSLFMNLSFMDSNSVIISWKQAKTFF